MPRKKDKVTAASNQLKLFHQINALIQGARNRVAVTVNRELVLLYWQVGKAIKEDILNNKRADYGEQVVVSLAKELQELYGKGWSKQQLLHCLRSAETFSKNQIIYAVRRQLSWTHLRTLIYINDKVKREFYLEMSSLFYKTGIANWSFLTHYKG